MRLFLALATALSSSAFAVTGVGEWNRNSVNSDSISTMTSLTEEIGVKIEDAATFMYTADQVYLEDLSNSPQIGTLDVTMHQPFAISVEHDSLGEFDYHIDLAEQDPSPLAEAYYEMLALENQRVAVNMTAADADIPTQALLDGSDDQTKITFKVIPQSPY